MEDAELYFGFTAEEIELLVSQDNVNNKDELIRQMKDEKDTLCFEPKVTEEIIAEGLIIYQNLIDKLEAISDDDYDRLIDIAMGEYDGIPG